MRTRPDAGAHSGASAGAAAGAASPGPGDDAGEHLRVTLAGRDGRRGRVATRGADREAADAEFSAFVRESSAELGRVAWYLTGDSSRAEDLLQTTLLRTYLHWPRAAAAEAGPLAYARRVMTNARTDAWRRLRRERLVAPADVPDAPEASGADAHAERDRLARALATLTPRQRRIVVLRHLVGLPVAEVAADLGVSEGTVKSVSSRGLAQLRAALGDDGPSAAAPPPRPGDDVPPRRPGPTGRTR